MTKNPSLICKINTSWSNIKGTKVTLLMYSNNNCNLPWLQKSMPGTIPSTQTVSSPDLDATVVSFFADSSDTGSELNVVQYRHK